MRLTWRLALCLLLAAPSVTDAAAPPDALTQAVVKGLRRLEQGAKTYTEKRSCFSCHHQATSIAAFVAARDKGLHVKAGSLKEQLDFTLKTFNPRKKRENLVKGFGSPGGNTMVVYHLFTLHTAGYKPDDTTRALVDYLLVRQAKDGAWPALMPRPPSEGSKFTNAALALLALKHYGEETKDAKRSKRITEAKKKGEAWLLKNEPATTEDRVFELRALATLGNHPKRLTAARDALLKMQLADGSWAQLKGAKGDAYATAHVMLALRLAGVKPEHDAYKKGVKWLLRQQTEHGAWIVTTRSRPVQTFFDNGDPGGKSQFISFAATGWAVLALLESVPARKVPANNSRED